MFFDIETSYCQGWFWQPSYNTRITTDQIIKESAIICICWKWEGEKRVNSLEWDKGNDKKMIKKFYKELLQADEVVGHNGDKFDLKWVRTQFIKHGIESMPEIKTIDTLKIARSKFKFKSNRLDYIGKFLGFGGKIDTGGIDLWHDIIQKNSKRAMKKMVTYCKRDVELLEKVFLKLEGYAKPKTHIGIQMGNDKCSCKYCGSENTYLKDRTILASGNMRACLKCKDCGKHSTVAMSVWNNKQAKDLGRK